jgi:hypothetical protein
MFHGKTTVAKYLEKQYGVMRHRFAGPIKALVSELLVQAGDRRDHAEAIVDAPALKDVPIRELYQQSPRDLMRAVGDIGRNIDPEFWANITMNAIHAEHIADPSLVFCIDDWRYPEGEGGRLLAGDVEPTFARVTRPGAPRSIRNHSSEGGLDDWGMDFEITNRENELGGLYIQADKLLEHVLQFDCEAE